MTLLATLLATLAAGASPPFVAADSGRDVEALLAEPYRALEQRDVDLDADGTLERAVIVGRVDDDGAAVPVGILLCELTRRRGLRLIAAGVVAANAAYDLAVAGEHVDLDGDGVLELAVDERISGVGVVLRATSYWRRHGDRLVQIYHLTRTYRFGERRERRTMTIPGPGLLEERVRVTEGPATTVFVVQLRYEERSGRFAPARFGVLR